MSPRWNKNGPSGIQAVDLLYHYVEVDRLDTRKRQSPAALPAAWALANSQFVPLRLEACRL